MPFFRVCSGDNEVKTAAEQPKIAAFAGDCKTDSNLPGSLNEKRTYARSRLAQARN